MNAPPASPRRVVYTAIYGAYEQLKPHAAVSGVDFFLL